MACEAFEQGIAVVFAAFVVAAASKILVADAFAAVAFGSRPGQILLLDRLSLAFHTQPWFVTSRVLSSIRSTVGKPRRWAEASCSETSDDAAVAAAVVAAAAAAAAPPVSCRWAETRRVH